MPQATAGRETAAQKRLLDAAMECARRDGVGRLTVQAIAARAGVSKALVLYHFQDKDELLQLLIERLTEGVIERQKGALAQSVAGTVMEDAWGWLLEELNRGEIAVLGELSRQHERALLKASDDSLQSRLDATAESVARIFQVLGLTPRVPIALLSHVYVAFIAGLALLTIQRPVPDPRIIFDVFWLSLLNLAE